MWSANLHHQKINLITLLFLMFSVTCRNFLNKDLAIIQFIIILDACHHVMLELLRLNGYLHVHAAFTFIIL